MPLINLARYPSNHFWLIFNTKLDEESLLFLFWSFSFLNYYMSIRQKIELGESKLHQEKRTTIGVK